MHGLRSIVHQVLRAHAVCTLSAIPKVQVRHSHYSNSKKVGDLSNYTDFEIIQNPPEWKYVERVLPIKYIPKPKPKDNYPSGWRPQTASADKLEYFVERTKNHLLPVYLDISFRGTRRITIIKNISGNIWKLNEDLTRHLQEVEKQTLIGSRVDEIACLIKLRGDHVYYTNQWLLSKGL